MNPLLEQLLPIPSESYHCDAMQDFLIAYAKKLGLTPEQDRMGNIYLTKGMADTYPCVVAHMDTVHRIEDGGIVLIEIEGCVTGMNPVTMEQTGIGGDDKCGIYAALRVLEALPACKAAFFVDEEVGCAGSSDCEVGFFANCRFVLQADRRGSKDWVSDISGPLGSKAFQKAVKPILKQFGFSPVSGAMSDVMALRDSHIGISVANMSAGYYNPHMACEFINLTALEKTTEMMLVICATLDRPFPFTYTRPVRVFSELHNRGFVWPRGPVAHKGPPSKLEEEDWLFEQKMKQELIERGQVLDVWDEPQIATPPVEEYCLNCQDVRCIDDMVQITAESYICKDCHAEMHGI